MSQLATYTKVEVRPSNSVLGAEIFGVDLAEPMDDATFEEIHRAWLEHQVIFFRDQTLTPGQQEDFARRFGELDTYPFIDPVPGHEHVIPIIKEKETRFNFGGGWHIDTPYQEKPPRATMLYALEVPERGGDTLFADMYGAYESLSPGMTKIVDDLTAVFSAGKVHGAKGLYKDADHPMEMKKDKAKIEGKFEHPAVRTHPETGRKSLYLDIPHVDRFRKMTAEESTPILHYLCTHATRPEFCYRFQWRAGSLAIWDNRCVQHYALNDYPGQRRAMHRITIKGEKPA